MSFSRTSIFAMAAWACALPAASATYPIPAAGADAAVQSALGSAKEGDTLRFAAGRIPVSKSILPKTGLVLLGEGDSATTLVWQGAASAMISLNGVSRVEIRDLGLEGGANAKTGIAAANGSAHTLHHLRFRDFRATEGLVVGIHFSSKATGSLIADNVFSSMGVDCEFGGGIRLTAGSGQNRILRNRIDRAGRGGIHLDGSRGNAIQGNVISGSGLSEGGANVGLGLEVWGGSDSSLIEDNIMDHWLSVDNSGFTAVRRNRIGTADGTYKWAGLELVGSSHSVFTGNTVEDGAHIGISMSNTPAKDEVYWGFNTIRKASTWGMQMQGEAQGASYHFFHGNTFAGTPGAHPKALYANQGHALRFNGNCLHVSFDSNTVSGNGGSALNFLGDSEDFSFTRNTIGGNGGLLTGAFTGAVLRWEANAVTGPGVPPPAKGQAKTPTAAFTVPATAKAGERLAFANQSKSASGTALMEGAKVLWDFGDGLPSNELSATHTYSADGVYRVTLIVWEPGGQGARTERTIVIGSGTDLADSPGNRRPDRSAATLSQSGSRFDALGRSVAREVRRPSLMRAYASPFSVSH